MLELLPSHGRLHGKLHYHFTTMHAMSYRSNYFTCSCRVNIYEAAVRYMTMLHLAIFYVELPRILILTVKSDGELLMTSLHEDIIDSDTDSVFIRGLRDLTLQILSDAGWASTNIGSKRPIH
jgi:hypothetical protein